MTAVGKAPGLPWCAEEWSPIFPFLWVGGHVFNFQGVQFHTNLADSTEFDAVYSFYTESPLTWPKTWPHPDTPHTIFEFADSLRGIAPEHEPMIDDIVVAVSDAIDCGQSVLLRCHAGLNRSALVAARVLMLRGMSADEAINLIRSKRSPYALSNPAFVAHLKEVEARG